jgi:WD40 repeat protein
MLMLILAWLFQAAQTPPPPDTDIYLATLTAASGGGLAIGQPANVTSSPGYDNQPSFTPDGRVMLFTSMRGGRQTDIYRLDVDAPQAAQVTNTPESEYSPTVTPDGGHISVIRVEADGTQRLWRFTLDGQRPEIVLNDVKPVGYHAWIDQSKLALFVLGQPATLQLADTGTGASEVVARGIGRSILRIPGRGTVSFVEREAQPSGGAAKLWIRELDPATKRITPLIHAVAGATEADCAWTPDGMLLMAHADELHAWRRGQSEWTRVVDLKSLGLRSVTRLAVSPQGNRISFVASPAR